MPSLEPAKRRALIILLALLGTFPAAITGCGSPEPAPTDGSADNASADPGTDPINLTIVFGVHANQPAPVMTNRMKTLVEDAVMTDAVVTLVQLDGCPSLVGQVQYHKPNQEANAGSKKAEAVAQVEASITGARAKCNGSDLTKALVLVHDLLSDLGVESGRLVILDSMLPDTGRINTTIPGILEGDHERYAAYLQSVGALPGLEGQTIELTGLGYTQPPQQELENGHKTMLKDLMEAVLRTTGADVTFVDAAIPDSLPNTNLTVNTTPLPDLGGWTESASPSTRPCQILSFPDDSPLHFVKDHATLVDEPAAKQHLAPFVDWLGIDPSRRIDVSGTCATGCAQVAESENLSSLRANKIRNMLIEMGADGTQVTAAGRGVINDPPIPIGKDGQPDMNSTEATQNRSVRFKLVADGCE